MLPTITKKRDFQRVKRLGKRWACPAFVMQAVALGNQTSAPSALVFGLILTKKITRRAVDRSLLRRRLKHALREILREKGNDTPLGTHHVVIVPRPGIHDLSFADLKMQLKKALYRLKLINQTEKNTA